MHLDAFQAGREGREAKQMRFPRKCETSFVGSAFIHSLLTMQPAIHHFPLNFIICKQFPCLILHRPKCNFTSHTGADVSWQTYRSLEVEIVK